ncbi:MAG: hypothetical protein AB7S71_01450 [Dongiaceae bacterium]
MIEIADTTGPPPGNAEAARLATGGLCENVAALRGNNDRRSYTPFVAPAQATSGLIRVRADGVFDRLPEFEPGALDADFLYVRDRDTLEIVDCIAWQRGVASPWWIERGLMTVIGEWELQRSWWDGDAAYMVATPRRFVELHGLGFCIVDWSADVNTIIGRAAEVVCETEQLREHLRQTLIRQAMPRIRITTASPSYLLDRVS